MTANRKRAADSLELCAPEPIRISGFAVSSKTPSDGGGRSYWRRCWLGLGGPPVRDLSGGPNMNPSKQR
jgi:hypothetical protein